MLVRPLLRAALIATTAALVLVPGTAAQAKKVTIKDAAGDLVSFDVDLESELTPDAFALAPAPGISTGDVTRTRINHGRKNLVVTVKTGSLSRKQQVTVVSEIQAAGKKYELTVVRFPGSMGHLAELSRKSGPVECAKLKHKVDFKRGRVKVTIPTTCLSKPRWVRLGLALGTTDLKSESLTSYLDEAFKKGTDGNRLKKSPKIPRG